MKHLFDIQFRDLIIKKTPTNLVLSNNTKDPGLLLAAFKIVHPVYYSVTLCFAAVNQTMRTMGNVYL